MGNHQIGQEKKQEINSLIMGTLNKINEFFGTSDYFGNNNTTPLIRELKRYYAITNIVV